MKKIPIFVLLFWSAVCSAQHTVILGAGYANSKLNVIEASYRYGKNWFTEAGIKAHLISTGIGLGFVSVGKRLTASEREEALSVFDISLGAAYGGGQDKQDRMVTGTDTVFLSKGAPSQFFFCGYASLRYTHDWWYVRGTWSKEVFITVGFNIGY